MAIGYTNLNCKLPAAREPCEGHDGLGRDTRVCVGKVWNLDESLHLFACLLAFYRSFSPLFECGRVVPCSHKPIACFIFSVLAPFMASMIPLKQSSRYG